MNDTARISATALRKVFDGRTIFQDVSFTVAQGETLLITGRNGSGKSTLVKILAGLLTPTAGSVDLGGTAKQAEAARLARVGFVAPYLQMYDEFSAGENIRLLLAMRGLRASGYDTEGILRRVGLHAPKADPVRTYSSGMKQRVKYAFALIHTPPVLLLDEPMANLDAEGIGMVRAVMEEQRSRGILVVATNDLSDVDRFDMTVNLDELLRR